MSKRPLSERYHAEKFVRGANLINSIPVLRKRLVDADTDGYVTATWHIAENTADTIQPWMSFRGDPFSGSWPRFYNSAAFMRMSAQALDAMQDEVGGLHAVGFALGNTVVVGCDGDPHAFSANEGYAGYYEAAMRRGRFPLRATMGLWQPDEQRLVVPHTSIQGGEVVPMSAMTQNESLNSTTLY